MVTHTLARGYGVNRIRQDMLRLAGWQNTHPSTGPNMPICNMLYGIRMLFEASRIMICLNSTKLFNYLWMLLLWQGGKEVGVNGIGTA